jgi:hypothetical protein
MFFNVEYANTVTVKVPSGASGYDEEWQTAFKGKGSDGSGTVNGNITVNIVQE